MRSTANYHTVAQQHSSTPPRTIRISKLISSTTLQSVKKSDASVERS